MRRFIYFLVGASFALGTPAAAQTQISFQADPDFLKLPQDVHIGEVAGVARNSRGDVYVYHRTGQPMATLGDERTFYRGGSALFQFDSSGNFIREVGFETYSMNYAQQVRVDADDNVYAVDAGSNMVMKFDINGRFLAVMGRKPESISVRPEGGRPPRPIDTINPPPSSGGGGGGGAASPPPGTGSPGHSFNRPADIAFDAFGNTYVADGFGNNNRVAKFNRDNNFVMSWGHTGSGPGQFNGVRGIAIDASGNVYVADAGNNRIQVFDTDGNFKSEITGIGSPQAICVSGGPTQYLYSSNSNDSESMNNGEIYKIALDGQVVGQFGSAGKIPGTFGMVNSLDCRSETDLLVGEIWNWRVQKVTLGR